MFSTKFSAPVTGHNAFHMSSQSRYKPVKLHYDKYIPTNCNYDLSPIIFLHGMMSIHSTWTRVKSKIAYKTQRQVYAVDLRNHGKSEWNDECCIDAHTADLENFIEQEGIKAPILIGHSLGGKTACNLALKKPEMVSKIVSEDVRLSNQPAEHIDAIHVFIKSLRKINNLPPNLTEMEAQKFVNRLVRYAFPMQNIPNDDFVLLPLHKNSDGKFEFDFNQGALEKSVADSSNYSLDFKQFKKFPGPTLFIFGSASPMKVDQDPAITEFFQNVQFCKLEGVGHMPHYEVFEEFVETVSKFINNC